MHAGLRIRLVGDGLYQLVGQLRHIHQLGPGPFQARAELRDEMRHSSLAASHTIGLEQAHLRPAQAKAKTDGVVDLLGGGDAVFHQPQRLAPYSLEETVGDKGLDFLADSKWMHADTGEEPGGTLDGVCTGGLSANKLDQRQKIDRIEGVADKKAVRAVHFCLKIAWQDAGCRRADQGVWRRGGLDLGIDRLFDIKPFRHRLDDQLCAGHRLGHRSGKTHLAATWQRGHCQLAERGVGIRHHRVDLARCFRIGIVDADIDTVLDQACNPAATDNAAADDRGTCRFYSCCHVVFSLTCRFVMQCSTFCQRATGARFVSFSRSRTASGPITFAPMFSTTFTAFSTSWALLANTPRAR